MLFSRPSRIKFLSLVFLLVSIRIYALPQTLSYKGLVSGWLTGNFDSIGQPFLGIRFIPEFFLEKAVSKKLSLDCEASLNAYATANILSSKDRQTSSKLRLYRMWGRFSSSRFEARLGLQKINFGSAALLRPLMWFDRLDPRDPLQLTDGVYGLLLRYYFLNNANIWAWGLWGDDTLKGWEYFPSKSDSAEFGGRVQLPLGKGEWALTYHHRQADPASGPFGINLGGDSSIPEDRFACDGKWDIGVGLWFEGTLTHQHSTLLPTPWQRALTVGLDYTFGLGNGLHFVSEYFIFENSRSAFDSGQGINFSALSLDYPLGLLDNLSSIFYYDWENHDLYSFLNWRRTYDRWIINVIGFWNPEQFHIYQNQPENNLFVGKGFQVMVIFNY